MLRLVLILLVLIILFILLRRISSFRALFDDLQSVDKYGILKTLLSAFLFSSLICFVFFLAICIYKYEEMSLHGMYGIIIISLLFGVMVMIGTAWRIFILRKYKSWLNSKIQSSQKNSDMKSIINAANSDALGKSHIAWDRLFGRKKPCSRNNKHDK